MSGRARLKLVPSLAEVRAALKDAIEVEKRSFRVAGTRVVRDMDAIRRIECLRRALSLLPKREVDS